MCSQTAETGATSREAETAAAAAARADARLARHQDAPAGSTAEVAPLTPHLALQLQAAENVRYHEDRQAFLDRAARWAGFIIVMASVGASASATVGNLGVAILAAGISAVVGVAQLVFDPSRQARKHHELRRDYIRILADAWRCDADLDSLRHEITMYWAVEPSTHFAVQALAYNAVIAAFDRPKDAMMVVPAWCRLTRHLFSFDPSMFATEHEMRKREKMAVQADRSEAR